MGPVVCCYIRAQERATGTHHRAFDCNGRGASICTGGASSTLSWATRYRCLIIGTNRRKDWFAGYRRLKICTSLPADCFQCSVVYQRQQRLCSVTQCVAVCAYVLVRYLNKKLRQRIYPATKREESISLTHARFVLPLVDELPRGVSLWSARVFVCVYVWCAFAPPPSV